MEHVWIGAMIEYLRLGTWLACRYLGDGLYGVLDSSRVPVLYAGQSGTDARNNHQPSYEHVSSYLTPLLAVY